MSFISHKSLEHFKGKEAWQKNLEVCFTILNKVKTTYGPEGSLKILWYNRGPEQVVKVTKMAEQVLKELQIQYPAAQIITEAAEMHRREIGDGVTLFCLLTTGLIIRAYNQIKKGINANEIIDGYQLATDKALEVIDKSSTRMEEAVKNIIANAHKAEWFLVEEVIDSFLFLFDRVKREPNWCEKNIVIVKRPSSYIKKSEIIRGVIIDNARLFMKEKRYIDNPKILFVDTHFGFSHPQVRKPGEGRFPFLLRIDTPEKLASVKKELHAINKGYADEAINKGANVLVCRQLVSEDILSYLAKNGILTIKSVDKKYFDIAVKATGASVVSDPQDIQNATLGRCEMLEISRVEPEDIVILHGASGLSIILSGSTQQSIDELESIINSWLKMMEHFDRRPEVVPGAGAIEMEISKNIKELAYTTHGKKQIAILEFAEAVEETVACLAFNLGLDPVDSLINLRSLHARGIVDAGLSKEKVYDMTVVKRSCFRRALEVARLLLRIDYLAHSKEIAKFHK